jgi:hypothetical protein
MNSKVEFSEKLRNSFEERGYEKLAAKVGMFFSTKGAYDVCNKEAVRHDMTVISRLYSDHRAGACNCRGNGLGNPARRWGSDVEKGKYALQVLNWFDCLFFSTVLLINYIE